MTSVVTVTVAGAVDLTYSVHNIRAGEVNRAFASRRELSGKGVNVARALNLAGIDAVGVVAIGEREAWMAPPDDAVIRPVLVAGSTRINTTLLDSSGTSTKINEAPAPLDISSWVALRDAALQEVRLRSADWLVVSGTVPLLAGTLEELPITELIAAAAALGVRVAIDTSGAALRHIAANAKGVTLIKPNTHELAELVGHDLHTVGDVIDAARTLLGRGIEIVYVSMGADGAVVVSELVTAQAHALARSIRNTVGAGDASLAGFIVGGERGGEAPIDVGAAVKRAAEFGALSVSQDTTVLHSIDLAPSASVSLHPALGAMLSEPAAFRP